jgi:AraC-like DNA-binding protein
MNMDALAHELGWNARMLHRAFVATCGYGPKYLQRILRVQGVVRAAQRPGRRLSEVSLDLGFADQAHMTRDFRRITGMTPTSYLAEAEAGVGRWLDEAW